MVLEREFVEMEIGVPGGGDHEAEASVEDGGYGELLLVALAPDVLGGGGGLAVVDLGHPASPEVSDDLLVAAPAGDERAQGGPLFFAIQVAVTIVLLLETILPSSNHHHLDIIGL